MTTVPAVVIDQLVKLFPGGKKPALRDLSARITQGQMVGLVGPDGAGKTTLIRLLVGLLHPTEGSIQVLGLDTKTEAHRIHEMCSYMPQKFGLYEDLSVIENLTLYADLRGVAARERVSTFKPLLEMTKLTPFQSRLAGKLSGGMKQKLGLACCLLGRPKILFLDEPSVGVDPISRRELWSMVQGLLKEGLSVVWSTSYLDEAEKCDSVILLNEGRKLYDGPPGQLLEQVQHRTWHLQGIPLSKRRTLLMKIIQKDAVLDGVVQGKHIRLLTRTEQLSELKSSLGKEAAQGHFVPVSPWFEDAFMDTLGGMADRQSALAAQMAVKPLDSHPIIEAQSLTKKFGSFTAVKDNSFTIQRGEIFGLLGPNGAGKSTTFKMMCGLLQPTTGKAFVKGLDLKTASSEARSKIGYMAQKFSLYGQLNVLQNLNFFSGLYGLGHRKQKQQVDLMIQIFNLSDYLKMNAQALPLGLKQRLALACSVMHEPDVLFLDEPTSGVDPLTRREFWMHINAMVEQGITVMVTTHFMDEAEYCDRIGLIYGGENIATGSPDDLKQKAVTPLSPNPTLEDAFIDLIRAADEQKARAAS